MRQVTLSRVGDVADPVARAALKEIMVASGANNGAFGSSLAGADTVGEAQVLLQQLQQWTSIAVDFTAPNTDHFIDLVPPDGFTRFHVGLVALSEATASLVAATAGLFTGAGGTGVQIVTGASAITVSSTAENTNNNSMRFTVNNGGTQSYNVSRLYFRVAAAVAAQAKVTAAIQWIS